MLTLNLSPIFKARGVERPFSFLVKASFTQNAAHNLLHSRRSTFRLVDVDKLCTLLHCTPNELLVWTPNRNEIITDTHPLNTLRNSHPDLNWQDTIKTVPLSELDLIVSTINKLKNDKQN